MKTNFTTLIAASIAAGLLSAFAADRPALTDDLKRGLVLYYDFDTEPVAGKIVDLSGSGNDGQAVGGRWVTVGHRGGAYRFAPPNQFIRVLNSSSLNPPHVTVAAWINTSRHDAIWRRVIDKDFETGFSITIGGGDPTPHRGKAFFEINCGSDWKNRSIGSAAAVNDGRWHHLVGTFDATGQRLYVDGRLQPRTLSDRRDLSPNGADLTIGLNPVNPTPNEVGASFEGLMDDIMIFNRGLSAKEVQVLFDSQKVASDEAAPPSAVMGAQPDAVERVKKLKDLYNQGLINKEEYDKKLKEIMDSL